MSTSINAVSTGLPSSAPGAGKAVADASSVAAFSATTAAPASTPTTQGGGLPGLTDLFSNHAGPVKPNFWLAHVKLPPLDSFLDDD